MEINQKLLATIVFNLRGTNQGIELAKRIKRLHALSDIKYQQLQDVSRDKQYRREAAILLNLSLILCLITVVGLGLLPSVFVLAKAEKYIVVSGT